MTTARRKAIDRMRRDTTHLGRERLADLPESVLSVEDALDELEEIPDDRLKLICTCCHPALPTEAQVALTLTTLGGLTTAEVARAFLTPLTTMQQRLVRAKRKIKDTGIPFEVPPAHRIEDRLEAVLHVVYLIFTEGYSASQGELLMRHDLCEEAIRLVRVLNALLAHYVDTILPPQRAEALGLQALLLLHHARRTARVGAAGELVLLAAQDRSRWDQAQIASGLALLDTALAMRAPGPYQIQAAISALHAQARTPESTDWVEIAALYGELLLRSPNPVVALNRAVALGMAFGPAAGLEALDLLADEPALTAYHPYHVARADLLVRAGQRDEAQIAYQAALERCSNAVERELLLKRAEAV
jgi:RNA polymerase sigma-70 factor (ECF subfamily)